MIPEGEAGTSRWIKVLTRQDSRVSIRHSGEGRLVVDVKTLNKKMVK